MNVSSVAKQLCAYGCSVSEHEPMAAHTSFKIGGAADLFVGVHNLEQAMATLRLCKQESIPFRVIGYGSNLLVSDAGIEGVVLRFLPNDEPVTVDGCRITAQAGASLKRLCTVACEHGLSGLEFAYGIPGTVGGGVYMNAGAYGGELCDTVQSVTALTSDGDVQVLSADDMQFSYRHSVLMERDFFVWSVEFALQSGDPIAIRKTMEAHMAARKEKQPLEYPSGGSFFKRPVGYFAGALIEQSGLKGYAVGGAQISEKHAGFVINRGGATCADVMTLCEHVQREVKEKFGVQLEREVQLIGR